MLQRRDELSRRSVVRPHRAVCGRRRARVLPLGANATLVIGLCAPASSWSGLPSGTHQSTALPFLAAGQRHVPRGGDGQSRDRRVLIERSDDRSVTHPCDEGTPRLASGHEHPAPGRLGTDQRARRSDDGAELALQQCATQCRFGCGTRHEARGLGGEEQAELGVVGQHVAALASSARAVARLASARAVPRSIPAQIAAAPTRTQANSAPSAKRPRRRCRRRASSRACSTARSRSCRTRQPSTASARTSWKISYLPAVVAGARCGAPTATRGRARPRPRGRRRTRRGRPPAARSWLRTASRGG